MTYDRVNWENEPSENTPLSAENLNKMDSAIKQLSEMVVANPVEADTDELKKITIEGTVYKIAGGHELVNASGSTMTQRSKMSFPDSHLTDDSGNNQTIVDIVKEVTTAQWNNATEEGLYYINDKPDSIITAEQVAYDNDNSVADMIDVQESYTIPTTPTDYGSFTFTRCGNTVQVEINGAKVSTAQTYIDITNSLPSKFRPTLSTRTVRLAFQTNEATPKALVLLIYSSGLVRMYGYSTYTGTYNIQDTKTYVV